MSQNCPDHQNECYKISYEIFLKRLTQKPIDHNFKEKIEKRINEIVQQHICLQDDQIKLHSSFVQDHDKVWVNKNLTNNRNHHNLYPKNYKQTHNNFAHNKRHIYSLHKNTTHVDTHLKRTKIGNCDDFSRSALSLLNKLSPHNFDKIKQNIIHLCDSSDHCEMMISFILKKAHKDYSYVQLYLSLLNGIPFEQKDIIQNATFRLMKTFLDSLPLVLENIIQNIEGENNLSKFIKAKKDVYDIHKTICTLIVFKFLNVEPMEYLMMIKACFDQMPCLNNYEIYDIFVHFLYDFFSIHNSTEIKHASQSMISDIHDKKTQLSCSKKTNFKWLDLMKLVG